MLVIHAPGLRGVLRQRGRVFHSNADHSILAAFHGGAETDDVFAQLLELRNEREPAGVHIHLQAFFNVRRIDGNGCAGLAGTLDFHEVFAAGVGNLGIQLNIDVEVLAIDHNIPAGFLMLRCAHDHGIGVVADGLYADGAAEQTAAIQAAGQILTIDKQTAAGHYLKLQRIGGGDDRKIILGGTHHRQGRFGYFDGVLYRGKLYLGTVVMHQYGREGDIGIVVF